MNGVKTGEEVERFQCDLKVHWIWDVGSWEREVSWKNCAGISISENVGIALHKMFLPNSR